MHERFTNPARSVLGTLIEGKKLHDLVSRHHGTIALRVRLGQSLAKVKQQNGVNEGQLRATQQEWHFKVAGISLTGEGNCVRR